MSTCINCVWEEFSLPLKRFIKKRVANEQDAEDIFQEIFLKIHKNIGGLMKENRLHAWIFRIAHNTIKDYYRRNNLKLESTDLGEDLESNTAEETSANTEIASCLKIMVESLPETYKQAILLTEFQSMTQKELSEKLGISLSGAKSRVQRGRKMLKEMLLGCCQLEIDSRGNIIDYKHKSSECKYC
ncbi:RNA polymerase sigma factor SigZ [Desulfosporosinus meridiei]|uniref:RNA polymerase sigma factor SigZ n=1 Tax=Desulfosporosinus meridiei (strain ATCC BAA-275 / DSM 13257 / KCTC 12902 / NCIMB 13706 / S10) TaxID=768704 RepID=J7IRD3_DESMD|nr:RNA polymerase sigma factor SigZ [Desulfosporosinus meridiei]AFQ44215.1 RNA polymerase, sigma subunit, SigZ [Desulfosporosinus meridiei DSM 13257]